MNIVTLDQLLSIKNVLIQNASNYNEDNQLLNEFICDQYDYLKYRKLLKDLLTKFKLAKYLYNFPIENDIKITPNYELKENSVTNSNVSKVEKAVERYMDKQMLTTDIYNSLVKLSKKLTNSEAVYLINTFINTKSEDDIAEIIGISKTYLQKIKKSCIVKMWIELKEYCENKDD